jgi:iron complex outermembrane receptor protein
MQRLTPLYLVMVLSASTAFGQSNYASLSGTAFDPQHQAVAGAAIQLVSESTHAARQITSNEQGVFQLTGLLPGDYKLTVQAAGFAPHTQSLTLEVGQQMMLDVSLKVGSLSTTLDVQTDAAAGVLHNSDAEVSVKWLTATLYKSAAQRPHVD